MTELTSSLEDYLEAMLSLQDKDGAVKSVDIASKLKVSRASVNKAVNLLRDEGYVTQERYSHIHFTPLGLKTASEVADTHRTLLSFFLNVLNVEPNVANEEACKVEHCVSRDTLLKLKAYLKTI